MAGRINITILDDKWPKLQMIVHTTLEDGSGVSVSDDAILYDQAYNKFEGLVHNHLRRVVSAVTAARKPKSQTTT